MSLRPMSEVVREFSTSGKLLSYIAGKYDVSKGYKMQ